MATAYISTSQKFGRLTTLHQASGGPNNSQAVWMCRCDCGGVAAVRAYNLKSEKTKSCGCLQKERTSLRFKSHGMTRQPNGRQTPEYKAWTEMKQRCFNPNSQKFSSYGGRGITVDKRWIEFSNFFADMGFRPSPKHSLDRVNNDGPYSPENCRWATIRQQSRNKRTNYWVMVDGKRQILADVCDAAGLPYPVVRSRLKRGWRLEDALKHAVDPSRKGPFRRRGA